jgi:hypothetical protein
MLRMSESPKLDITQIEKERRSVLELVLIVVLLGLLLNCLASAVYDHFKQEEWVRLLLWISVVASTIILATFVWFGLLHPIKLCTEIPVVLFYDTSVGTISVPVQIHYPRSEYTGVGAGLESLIPFPILCRLKFDEYKEYVKINQSDLSDIEVQQDILASLVQYVVIDHYTKEHYLTWGPRDRVTIGPFWGSSHGYCLPSQVYDRAELASRSGNKFIEMNANGPPMRLPHDSKVQFPSSDVLVLSSPLYRVEIKIPSRHLRHMGGWKSGRGLVSSWYRELSSDFSSTYALFFGLQVKFALDKRVFWRLFAEDWLPVRLRPKIALRDVCDWINSWITSAHQFFEWVDEDLSVLPDTEKAVLVDESTLVYRSRLQSASPVVFRNMLFTSFEHRDVPENPRNEPSIGHCEERNAG